MSLATSREQRATAGNRMSKLLDAEEEDEFYKTTYGGFNDESGDDEYKGDQSDTEDEVDSDFDIDEGDEPDSDQEEDAPRRKSRVVTKAYKEPVKVAKPKTKRPSEELKKTERAKATQKRSVQEFQDFGEIRKSVRQSTSEHTRKTNLRLQERQEAPRRRRGAHHDRPLTQDELLAEAKITAEINLRSLENYERLEADKKKQVHKKQRFDGPTIRYHSVLMPLLSDSLLKEENVDVEGLDQDTPQTAASSTASQNSSGALCSRSFITLSDQQAFEAAFPSSVRASLPLPVQEVCPITHKAALYRDPVTDIPYANARAFRIIREAYRKYVAAHGFPSSAGGLAGSSNGDASATASAAKGVRQKMVVNAT
ncbi:vacuolar protein sorting 72 homolog a [Denticeps clupeoides]|uniref:Vacuolar protein sorting-associated protein 72 homolog n=1 Tax=Denticeps clupeoides TaxID=299321 RepID=A0AAY4EYE1_9TELE|nr:vacuolar protein sorting-associated protein 72 homolog [Denticeps clupeoides]